MARFGYANDDDVYGSTAPKWGFESERERSNGDGFQSPRFGPEQALMATYGMGYQAGGPVRTRSSAKGPGGSASVTGTLRDPRDWLVDVKSNPDKYTFGTPGLQALSEGVPYDVQAAAEGFTGYQAGGVVEDEPFYENQPAGINTGYEQPSQASDIGGGAI